MARYYCHGTVRIGVAVGDVRNNVKAANSIVFTFVSEANIRTLAREAEGCNRLVGRLNFLPEASNFSPFRSRPSDKKTSLMIVHDGNFEDERQRTDFAVAIPDTTVTFLFRQYPSPSHLWSCKR